MTLNLLQHLHQTETALDNMHEDNNMTRAREILEIQVKIRRCIKGLSRVPTENMVRAVLATLDEITPRIQALARTRNYE